MRIYHIATVADWRKAQKAGEYTTSTLGRTLTEVGFIHAAHREQVGPTYTRFYARVKEPLVLLTIDTDRLTSPWREEEVASDGAPGEGTETFPHIYGPLPVSAVTRFQPLNARGGTESLTQLWFQEMGLRMGLVVVAMILAGLGALLAGRSWGEDNRFYGAVIGLAVGALLGWLVMRRRS